MLKRSLIVTGLFIGTLAAFSQVAFGDEALNEKVIASAAEEKIIAPAPEEKIIVPAPESAVKAAITSATVQMQHVVPGNPTSKSVTVNKDVASALYQLIQELPPTTGLYYGAVDPGVRYQVNIARGNGVVATAEVNPTNLGYVTMNGKTVSTVGSIGNQFWSTLAAALSVNVDQLRSGTVSMGTTALLDLNPTKVIVTKNNQSITLTRQTDMNQVVAAINDVAKSQDPTKLHCLAITNDNYRIQIIYGASKTRSFHNDGGSCLPLVDEQTGASLEEAGAVLTLVSGYLH